LTKLPPGHAAHRTYRREDEIRRKQHVTLRSPATIKVPGAAGSARIGGAPEYLVCRICVRRFRVDPVEEPVAPEGTDGGSPSPQPAALADEPRCECGARLHPYVVPVELSAPARGVLPRLTRFWIAGREDGFWHEQRFFRSSAAERAGVTPRQVRFAYQAGLRAGERVREGARLHALRVMRMKLGAGAARPAGRLAA
jgi:hypothetical protein